MAPDLETVVRAEGLDKATARRLAAESRERDGLPVEARRLGFRGPWELTIPDLHDLLTDEAELEAVTWAMDPGGLERLAGTLEWLLGELPRGFTFEALWGESPIDSLVTRDELLRIVRAGRVGTRTRYRVMAP